MRNLIKNYAELNQATTKSWSGWIITYAHCLIIWASRLQMQVALSITEDEYITLSTALRDAIRLMLMAIELREKLILTFVVMQLMSVVMALRITPVLRTCQLP